MSDRASRPAGYAMPVDAPVYPPPPSSYRDVTLYSVHFRVEPGDIAPLLPSPLEPAGHGRCCVFAVDVPFCADYGPFREMGVCVGCELEGKQAFFLPCLLLDNPDAIAAGREIYGSPKKQATVRFDREGAEFTATAVRAGVEMIQMNLRLTGPIDAAKAPALWPMYVLKVIPSAVAGMPALRQLLASPAPEARGEPVCFEGDGVVSFRPTVAGQFWRLRPTQFDRAYYQHLPEYGQGLSTLVRDVSGKG